MNVEVVKKSEEKLAKALGIKPEDLSDEQKSIIAHIHSPRGGAC